MITLKHNKVAAAKRIVNRVAYIAQIGANGDFSAAEVNDITAAAQAVVRGWKACHLCKIKLNIAVNAMIVDFIAVCTAVFFKFMLSLPIKIFAAFKKTEIITNRSPSNQSGQIKRHSKQTPDFSSETADNR